MARGRWPEAFVLLVAAVAGVGCNTRTPIHDSQVFITAPTGWANAPAPSAPGGDLTRIELSPTVAIGGGGGRGTVFLDGPAPDGGLAVSLASEVSAMVGVTPSVVTIPAGSFSADFAYTTISATRDADISIIASTPARSRSARISVWAAVLPSFYFHLADPSDLVRGAPSDRVTSDMGAAFHAFCIGNVVGASATPPLQSTRGLSFAAAGLQPLRPGVYENATPSGTGNRMQLGVALSCQSVGRFQVREIEVYANGDVTNLWVTFEAGCPGRPGTIRGEFRATNLRRTVNRFTCAGGS